MSRLPLLSKALRSITFRWVLLLLLLLSQQAALVHALGHASAHVPAPVTDFHVHGPGCDSHAAQEHHAPADGAASEFCAFDLVLSSLLGGLPASHMLHLVATETVGEAVAVAQPHGKTAGVPYDSRGPPAFS